MTDDNVVTIGERYAIATVSKNLTPKLTGRTDADVLLGAGIAASRDHRRMLALKLYRLAVAGDTSNLLELAATADGWLLMRLARGGNRPMPAAARVALIEDTFRWWIKPHCGYCDGLGRVKFEDAGRLSTLSCDACHGTGKRPLAREVPHPYIAHAEWLSGELDRLVALIHAEMSRLLSQKMDLSC